MRSYFAQSLAQREALALFRSQANDLDWTYISPPRAIVPGSRTGSYRIGFDQMIFDANGVSTISMEDYAVALVDELAAGQHPKSGSPWPTDPRFHGRCAG